MSHMNYGTCMFVTFEDCGGSNLCVACSTTTVCRAPFIFDMDISGREGGRGCPIVYKIDMTPSYFDFGKWWSFQIETSLILAIFCNLFSYSN